jgi:3-oxoadipate enol-lactonase
MERIKNILPIISILFLTVFLSVAQNINIQVNSITPDITGAWNLVYMKSVSDGTVAYSYPGNITGTDMKIWSGNHFACVGRFTMNGEFINNYVGGTYTLNGNRYQENIEYHANETAVGANPQMLLVLKGDTLIQTWPVDAVGLKSGYAEINNTRIYYQIYGAGESIVLIHGWSFDLRCWEALVPALAKDYQVISYDLRGFGKSALPQPSKPYSHTVDLLELLNFLQIKKAIFLGHSYGGRIALDIALRYPERVEKLILPEAAMDAVDFKHSEELTNWVAKTWSTGRTKGINEAKDIWINSSPFFSAMKNKFAAPVVKKMVADYTGWHWINYDPVIRPQSYQIEELAKIEVPVLILYGAESPGDYYIIAELQHKYIRGSKLVRIESAGHALNIENPEQFNLEILKFIK